MMIVDIVPGVSWYDNFEDAVLGAVVPIGWTKYGSGAAPTVVSDSDALAGKALFFPNAVVGLGMNIAGSPDNFEVMVRLKATGECSGTSWYGGPGGRISMDGVNMRGMGFTGGNRKTDVLCPWPCSGLDITNPYYTPPFQVQYNPPYLLRSRAGGSGPFGTLGTGQNSNFKSSPASGFAGGPSIFNPEGTPGNTLYYQYMKMRVVTRRGINTYTEVKGKWWTPRSRNPAEPTSWLMEEDKVPNTMWPATAGPVGIVSIGEGSCAGSKIKVDYIAVSIDPEAYPLEVPDGPKILSQCPLPPGNVGVPYSFTLAAENTEI